MQVTLYHGETEITLIVKEHSPIDVQRKKYKAAQKLYKILKDSLIERLVVRHKEFFVALLYKRN